MATSDKPKVTVSFSEIQQEAQGDPFVLGTSKGTITFPSPGDMTLEEGEKFLEDLENAETNRDLFTLWLSEADVKKLEGLKMTLMQTRVLFVKIREHYRTIFGDLGEDAASAT